MVKKDGYSRKYDSFTLKDISKLYEKYEDKDKFKGISVAFYDGFEKVEFPKNYEPFIEFERKGNDIRLNVGFEMPEAEEDEIKEFLRTYKTALITSDGQFILKNS